MALACEWRTLLMARNVTKSCGRCMCAHSCNGAGACIGEDSVILSPGVLVGGLLELVQQQVHKQEVAQMVGAHAQLEAISSVDGLL
eukprot:1143520-Pelagomonas_calceolata.AAC.3